MSTPFNALKYLSRGFDLIRQPGLRRFLLWPILINVVLLIAVTAYAYHLITQWLEFWTGQLPTWIAFVEPLIKMLIFFSLSTACVFCFAFLTTVIGAPFYSFLAESVAIKLGYSLPATVLNFQAMLNITARSFMREIEKLLYYIPRTLLLVILSFIPILNAISPFLWVLWGAWLMSIQFADYAADNDHVAVKTCREKLAADRINALTMGGLIMLGMMVPILNIVLPPVAVAAATAWWVDQQRDPIS